MKRGFAGGAVPQWSVVLAYYNERDFIADTLKSLAAQSYRPFDLILVDNGSSDGSAAIARDAVKGAAGINAVFLEQPLPGQLHALNMGVASVRTPFVAICDADTHYPPHYLEQCSLALGAGNPSCVGVMATDIYAPPGSAASIRRRLHVWLVSRILRRQAHSGGYAYAFRTDALRAAGSYDVAHWPYVLSDHELVHRMLKGGRMTYPFGHWCMPSTRRPDDPSVRWSIQERILYHVVPFGLKDWFFYRFLAARFERRRMDQANYRVQPWAAGD